MTLGQPDAQPDDAALLAAWATTVRGAGGTAPAPAVAAAGAGLLARWREPHRRHHDAEHLAETLTAVDLLAGHAADADVVRLAVWFHDAVYAGRPGDDEEASAALAEQLLPALGVPAATVAAVAGLVRMTAGHEPAPGDADAAVLSDADLAVLAAPPPRYARYARAVRAEYAHVPDAAFRAGRAAVLGALVAAPALYRTPTGHALWEAAARANVAAETAALTGGGADTLPR